MRERALGAMVVALVVLLVMWPIMALIVIANSVISWPYAIGLAVVVGLVAFALDAVLTRRE